MKLLTQLADMGTINAIIHAIKQKETLCQW